MSGLTTMSLCTVNSVSSSSQQSKYGIMFDAFKVVNKRLINAREGMNETKEVSGLLRLRILDLRTFFEDY